MFIGVKRNPSISLPLISVVQDLPHCPIEKPCLIGFSAEVQRIGCVDREIFGCSFPNGDFRSQAQEEKGKKLTFHTELTEYV